MDTTTTAEPSEGRGVLAAAAFVVAIMPLATTMSVLPALVEDGPRFRTAREWLEVVPASFFFLGIPMLIVAGVFLAARTALERRWPGGGVPLLAPAVGLAALWGLGREAPAGAGIYLWALLVALLALELAAGPPPPRRLRAEAEKPQVGAIEKVDWISEIRV